MGLAHPYFTDHETEIDGELSMMQSLYQHYQRSLLVACPCVRPICLTFRLLYLVA